MGRWTGQCKPLVVGLAPAKSWGGEGEVELIVEKTYRKIFDFFHDD